MWNRYLGIWLYEEPEDNRHIACVLPERMIAKVELMESKSCHHGCVVFRHEAFSL